MRFGPATPLEEYAVAIAGDDPDERRRARHAFGEHRWQTAAPAAKLLCRRLNDRNARCSGQVCDGPFLLFLAWLIGRSIGDEAHEREPWIVTWIRAEPRAEFAAYVVQLAKQPSVVEDALRQWNKARDLPQRPRPPAGFFEQGPDRYRKIIEADLRRHPDDRTVISMLHERPASELRRAEDSVVWEWATALWWDACQPAYEMIDADRVARHLRVRLELEGPLLEPGLVDVVGRIAFEVDRLMQHWEAFYDGYLGRPRQHTRLNDAIGDSRRFDDLMARPGANRGTGNAEDQEQ